jgi:hypothetical protein
MSQLKRYMDEPCRRPEKEGHQRIKHKASDANATIWLGNHTYANANSVLWPAAEVTERL